MSEAPTIGPAINLNDPDEVAYWMRRLRITRNQLAHLVQTLRLPVPVPVAAGPVRKPVDQLLSN